MTINRKYIKLINETLRFLEKQNLYENFLDNFTQFVKNKLPANEIDLFYLNNDESKYICYSKKNEINNIETETNLIKHLNSTKKTIIIKHEDPGLANVLKKDNSDLFSSLKIDIIIPLTLHDSFISGFIIIEANRNSYKDISQLNEYFKFISNIIISNIKVERDDLSKRVNFLKQFRHDRLAITGELAATASHEIKNIHGAIKAALPFFYEKNNVSPIKLKELIERMKISIEQSEYILKSMLSISKHRNIDTESIDISIFIEEIINFLTFRVSKNIKVEKFFKKDLIIHSSYQLLSQAIINIFINSIDAIGSKVGKITIKTNIIISNNNQKGKAFIISIKDTGPGFDQTILDNLYSKFKTTKKQGTGLGLYNTLNIIKRIGGDLGIKSSQAGSEVIIKLPERMK